MKVRTTRSASAAQGVVFGALILLSLFVSSGSAMAQEFTARVDRTRLAENETLTLDVLYAERADTESIDFESALGDFSILSFRPSSQTRYVNGRRSSQTSWQLTLAPKRSGRLQIPAFEIKGKRTRPIQVDVEAAPDSPDDGAPFSASLELDRSRAFIGEQILATISLIAQRGIGNLSGSALEIDGAETTLVNQRDFQRTFQGQTYQVTELIYAVFPNRAGPLEIGPQEYRGQRRRIQRITARTKPVVLDVLDPASDPSASSRKPWFPAAGVALASEWNGDVDDVRVGEPITRTIRIAAAGQRAAAIIPLRSSTGAFKQYREQPELKDTETSSGILGSRIESIVLVPTEPGVLELPSIEIDWWNIETRRWETARIPAETLQVAASTSVPGTAPSEAAPATQTSEAETIAPASAPKEPGRVWAWVAAALAALSLALGMTCVGLWRRVRALERGEPGNRIDQSGSLLGGFLDRSHSDAQSFARLLSTISNGELESIRSALIEWGKQRWPEQAIASLDDLVAAAPEAHRERGAELLHGLDEAIYGRQARPPEDASSSAAIDGEPLKRWVEVVRQAPPTPEADRAAALPPLYPNA